MAVDWDVRYPKADTDGEKPYEEFFTNDDVREENSSPKECPRWAGNFDIIMV